MKVTDTKGVKWLVVLPIKILSLAGLWWKTTVSAYSLPCLCWIAFSCNPVAGINVSYARFWKTTDKFKLSVSFCWNLMFVPLQLFLSVSLSSHHCVCLSLGTKTIWFGLGLAGNTCSGCHHKKKKQKAVSVAGKKRTEKRPHGLKLQLPVKSSFINLTNREIWMSQQPKDSST